MYKSELKMSLAHIGFYNKIAAGEVNIDLR